MNYTEGLYEGREPGTFMERYTVDFRDAFAKHLAKIEGLNPRIYCGESIPKNSLDTRRE
jgi:hypothetical protein